MEIIISYNILIIMFILYFLVVENEEYKEYNNNNIKRTEEKFKDMERFYLHKIEEYEKNVKLLTNKIYELEKIKK